VALLAIRVCEVFLAPGEESGAAAHAATELDIAEAVVEANERFEAARVAVQASSRAGRRSRAGARSTDER
jgi:hypothetical protein